MLRKLGSRSPQANGYKADDVVEKFGEWDAAEGSTNGVDLLCEP
jgi:hypothetical protein